MGFAARPAVIFRSSSVKDLTCTVVMGEGKGEGQDEGDDEGEGQGESEGKGDDEGEGKGEDEEGWRRR